MSLKVLQKNISINARLLKRYGRFKKIVIRKMQLRLFNLTLRTLLNKDEDEDYVMKTHIKKVYEYYSNKK